MWLTENENLKDKYPQLHSYARKPKYSVKYFIEQDYDETLFRLPLSQQAASQLDEIISALEEAKIDSEQEDRWVYKWGNDKYSSKKAYKQLAPHYEAPPLFCWLWSSSNLGKHKFFFWLLLKDID